MLEVDGQNIPALLGLATVYVETGDLAQASATLALIPPDGRKSAAYAALTARIELASKAPVIDNSAELETRLIANPADHQARYDLAVAQAARGDTAAAVDNLLEIIRRDRMWNEEGARKQLVLLFEAWGPKHEATLDGRRKLSSLLFR